MAAASATSLAAYDTTFTVGPASKVFKFGAYGTLNFTFTASLALAFTAIKPPGALIPDVTAAVNGPTLLTVQLVLGPQTSFAQTTKGDALPGGPLSIGPGVPFEVGVVPFIAQPFWDVPYSVTLSVGAPLTYTLTTALPGALSASYAFVDVEATTGGDGFALGS